jgi:hypothetical protein
MAAGGATGGRGAISAREFRPTIDTTERGDRRAAWSAAVRRARVNSPVEALR